MIRMSRCLVTSAILCLSVCAASLVSAQNVYVAGSGNELGILNVSTDAYTPIGVTSQLFFGIAFAPNGTLYGISAASSSPGLYTINTTTAATTLVGSTGIPDPGYGLAFTPSGTLYTMDLTSNLYTVSTGTGAATLVGAIGNHSSGSVEFGANGVLYETDDSTATDTLDSIDLATGAGTPIGATGFNDIFGLAAVNGKFYGFDAARDFIALDTSTGAGTHVGSYSLSGTDAVEDATVPIAQRVLTTPEPGLSSFLIASLLSGAGLLFRRRCTR